jgi:hypothetical protein
MSGLRSIRRVSRHMELLQLLITHPNEGRAAMQALGVEPHALTQKEEKRFINEIKGRVNGSVNSR